MHFAMTFSIISSAIELTAKFLIIMCAIKYLKNNS